MNSFLFWEKKMHTVIKIPVLLFLSGLLFTGCLKFEENEKGPSSNMVLLLLYQGGYLEKHNAVLDVLGTGALTPGNFTLTHSSSGNNSQPETLSCDVVANTNAICFFSSKLSAGDFYKVTCTFAAQGCSTYGYTDFIEGKVQGPGDVIVKFR